MRKAFQVLVSLWVALLVAIPPAYAYLDPGSGSMLLQLLLGGIAGLTVLAKMYWNRLLTLFRIKKKEHISSAGGNLQSPTRPETSDRMR
jgi:hypothetical protein